jgi:hypothetical protein
MVRRKHCSPSYRGNLEGPNAIRAQLLRHSFRRKPMCDAKHEHRQNLSEAESISVSLHVPSNLENEEDLRILRT